ncbi:MAG TPA: TolC family protein [Edaphocola sp.]|nr:TolC family protein [Edaphocola sp.]
MKKNKKIYQFKLVNAHKLIALLVIFSATNNVVAQGTWTLNQCLDTAQVYNKTLQISRNNISMSKQKQMEAKANLLPKINANVDYKYFMELPTQLMPTSALNPQVPEGQYKAIQFGVPHNINANVQLAMPLYNPAIYGAIENTKIANELTQIQYQKSEEQVLYDITTLYYNAQILKHQLDFLETNLINTRKLLQNTQLLWEQLLAKGTDVNKVQLQIDLLNTQKDNTNNKYIQILNALKLNMGIDLRRDISIKNEINFQKTIEYSEKTILDIKLIQTQNKLLNSELNTLKKSQIRPSLNLIASYGTSGFGYHKTPNDFLKFYTNSFAGLQLSYPIFNGTVTQTKINQKKLEINNNELQVQLMDDKNKMEIENLYGQKTIAQQTIFNTEKQTTLAQSIYEKTIIQQKQGTASLTDIILADNALREAQQHYLSAIIDYLKADLELKRVMGQLSVNK